MTHAETFSTATGNIGALTWPHVPADVEPPHPEGIEQFHGSFAVPASGDFAGVYAFCSERLSGEVRIEPGDHPGVLRVRVALEKGCAGTIAPLGAVEMSAEVRERWLVEATRGATSRAEQGERIAAALIALALIPNQKTVTVS